METILNRLSTHALIPMFILVLLNATCVCAQALEEYEVKAAFIHNIAKFVEWPAHSADTLKLCVIGQDPFAGALDALQGKTIGDRLWDVSFVRHNSGLSRCDVLFIASSEKNNLGRILENIQGRAVLTISDTEGYAEQGVMVNFYLEQNRVRFEINNEAARRAGFKIGSQLLKLARIVVNSGESK